MSLLTIYIVTLLFFNPEFLGKFGFYFGDFDQITIKLTFWRKTKLMRFSSYPLQIVDICSLPHICDSSRATCRSKWETTSARQDDDDGWQGAGESAVPEDSVLASTQDEEPELKGNVRNTLWVSTFKLYEMDYLNVISCALRTSHRKSRYAFFSSNWL